MKWFLRATDAIGDWIAEKCPPKVQRRIGVWCMLASLPLFVLGFFVNEPFVVFQMSAGALLVGGVSTIVAALDSSE